MSEQIPTVIVDDLHINYRVVLGSGTASAAGALRSLVSGKGPGQLVKNVHAVRGVSLVANEGDTIGLIGRNGSGKSSLLKAVAGLLKPTSGSIYTASQASLLGVGAALNKSVSGQRNITLGGLAMGMSRDEVERLRPEILKFADLDEFIEMPMGTYSSGMQARLRFAIATARTHEILLVDEALNTGDTEFRRKAQAKIRELTQAAGTVFVVAHGHTMIKEMCNRAIWMDKGTIKLDGPTDEVLAAYEADIEQRRNS
jgi:teichoic acid transport system ATP-binding protein